MPQKNGLEVVKAVRDLYASIRDTLELTNPGLKLKEPIFVFLTAYASLTFRKYLSQHNIMHCYEKPLQIEQLENILALAE